MVSLGDKSKDSLVLKENKLFERSRGIRGSINFFKWVSECAVNSAGT
jgi:hypothetical protein